LFGYTWPGTLRFNLGIAITALVCVLQVGLVVDAIRQIHDFRRYSPDSMLGLNAMISLRDAAVRPGIETIYLVEGGGPKQFEQLLTWLVLSIRGPSRVLWGDNFGLPVPAAGAAMRKPPISRNSMPRDDHDSWLAICIVWSICLRTAT
jgi:hypothetical protein